MSADRELQIVHSWNLHEHGRSLERVPLHVGHASGGAFSDLPPIGSRDALFLAIAYQTVGVSTPTGTPSPDASARAPFPEGDQAELLTWARSTLDLLARLTQREWR